MGFSIKFNWVLQFDIAEPLTINHSYSFKKPGNRVFPIDTAIDLIDSQRSAVAKIKIKSFSNELDITTGTFEVIKIYVADEKRVLTNYWIENK